MTEISTPNWTKHAIFYQIFPDRFSRSSQINHPPGLRFKPWGTPPEEQGFQGGDLYGIIENIDYLQDLGINALYLNPIFSSASNHRYHTYDYYQVDPLLGGNKALRKLLDVAHDRGIRIVLDGVFNHASRGFWAFHHILETGINSPYLDWFEISEWPLRPYNSDEKFPHNYRSWINLPALPEFNTDNPVVREYIFDVARHWLEFGIDGWRLDVPADIDDDEFWQEFRQIVKGVNKEAYICGEIWLNAQRWLQGDQFDGVMNYLITSPLLSFFGGKSLRPGFQRENLTLSPINAEEFSQAIGKMYSLYAWEINYSQMNMLDSHDMARALWIMSNDKAALKLCVLAMMTLPGAPCIYYGDEIGMSSAGDPFCRGAFPWHEKEKWDLDLLEHYKNATTLRNNHPIFRVGSFRSVYAKDDVYAFLRGYQGQLAFVVFNNSINQQQVRIPLTGVQQKKVNQIWPSNKNKSIEFSDRHLGVMLPKKDGLVILFD